MFYFTVGSFLVARMISLSFFLKIYLFERGRERQGDEAEGENLQADS